MSKESHVIYKNYGIYANEQYANYLTYIHSVIESKVLLQDSM